MTTRAEVAEALNEVAKKLVDEGKLVEAGFAAYLALAWGIDAINNMPGEQLNALRQAFFSGAQHLWGTMTNMLDPGEGVTDDDERRMEQINSELKRWIATMARDHYPTQGSA